MPDVPDLAALRGRWPFTDGWTSALPEPAPRGSAPRGAPAGDAPATLARLAALRDTALLDSPAEPAFDRLARLAARLLGAPIALVTLVDADRQFFKSCIGLPEPWASLRATPLSHSFCQHAVAQARPLVIDDAREHPLVRDNLAIRDLGVVAYAGIPLVTADGVAIGSFCVIDGVPRRWAADDVATLAELAESVVTEIELRAALRRTEAARAEAAAATRAKDAVLAFVGHELRTPLTGIACNAELLATGRCGPLTDRQARAVGRIARSQGELLALTNRLLEFRTLAAGHADYMLARVDVAEALADAVHAAAAALDEAGVRVERAPGDDAALAVHADAAKLRQVLVTLLAHAARRSPRGATVTVEAEADAARVRLRVGDAGPALAPEQRARAFEPFAHGRVGRDGRGHHRARRRARPGRGAPPWRAAWTAT
jgi:signal transduction histidine kinase